jgi:hypothetical protein
MTAISYDSNKAKNHHLGGFASDAFITFEIATSDEKE